jgi:hypothetical protein
MRRKGNKSPLVPLVTSTIFAIIHLDVTDDAAAPPVETLS